MKLPDTQKWIADNFFIDSNPCTCVIVDVRIGMNKYGRPETILALDNSKLIRELSIYGENYERCKRVFTDESTNWIGKKVNLSQTVENGKKVRYVVPA